MTLQSQEDLYASIENLGTLRIESDGGPVRVSSGRGIEYQGPE